MGGESGGHGSRTRRAIVEAANGGEALARETETGGSPEREQKPNGRGQDPRSLFQLLDGAQELLAVMAERFEADNGAQATTLPTGDGRARDVHSGAERTSAGAVDMLAETVVVRAALRGR